MAERVYHVSPFMPDRGIWTQEFEHCFTQSNDFEIYTSHFLARDSTLLGSPNDWLIQHQDNVNEWYPMGTAL